MEVKKLKSIFTCMRLLIVLLASTTFVTPVSSQSGSNDPTFNPTDKGFGFGDGANGNINTTSIQSDGKIIIGGAFTSYNGTARNYIARLNSDGTLDTSFNPGTGTTSTIHTTSIQSDGKIIIGGLFTSYNGTARNNIARLNTDGSLDLGFNPVTGTNGTIYSNSIQSDGKIIIVGNFNTYNGTMRNNIARLNTDGNLDTSFNPGTGANNMIYTTSVQSDGKIIIGGAFTSYNATAISRIARLNIDGSLDTNFITGAGASNIIYSTTVQSDGKILIGGQFTTYNTTAINRIARLNTDGSLDAGFNTGTGASSTIRAAAIQSNGKIIIGGEFTSFNGKFISRITRLNTDGSLDSSFNPGRGVSSPIYSTSLLNDGKIIIGGAFAAYNIAPSRMIARINTDGSRDVTFNPSTGANNAIQSTSIQSDGKIIIGGWFTSFNGTIRDCIVRLNSDGSLDSSFNPGAGANNIIFTTAIQSDGKIIIGGAFTFYNGKSINRIARLKIDGSLDSSFNPGTVPGLAPNNVINSISIQGDGKIIIGGAFYYLFNGQYTYNIARLNTDGSLDSSFNHGAGANNTIYTTNIQSDGKIIIGGIFTSYNGTPRKYIARLNTNGSLDAGFNSGIGPDNSISATSIQSDGKIIIGGEFTSYNGSAINRIARLHTDGSLDTGFFGPGTDWSIRTTAIQSDGKIIIAGISYVPYLGKIARLNTNGSVDAGFNPGTGANDIIFSTAIQSDGKIIIGGAFNSYNGIGRNRLARLIGDGPRVSAPTDYFRTITSGNWNAPATWESATDSTFTTGLVSPATLSPDFNASAIIIRNPHTITITADVTIINATVIAGGSIVVAPNVVVTVK